MNRAWCFTMQTCIGWVASDWAVGLHVCCGGHAVFWMVNRQLISVLSGHAWLLWVGQMMKDDGHMSVASITTIVEMVHCSS